ncbi:acetyltransferase (GNAT) family protein [mine drainage metagenome]|uniref:Acetyltransferase (GNAT) family protein n=1 Tax=mine drainage metagenome TaxID=410659 RepID=A0A1J5T4J7_9ZZZZ
MNIAPFAERLQQCHLGQIEAHLAKLSAEDLAFCFFYPATMDSVRERYLARLDPARDILLGIQIDGDIAALAHLYVEQHKAEVGLTVLPEYRERGLGEQLFEASILEARALGCSQIAIETRPDNAPMIALARSHGFAVGYDYGNIAGRLELRPLAPAGMSLWTLHRLLDVGAGLWRSLFGCAPMDKR